MKLVQIVVLLFLSLGSASISAAHALDWESVQNLKPLTQIDVSTQHRTRCYFLKATSDNLFCQRRLRASSSPGSDSDLLFNREDIVEVRMVPVDQWSGFLDLLFMAGGGADLNSAYQPSGFAGTRLGGAITLDLKYDAIQGKSGFSTQGTGVLSLFRFPGPREDQNKKFVKLYAEPGVGYRAGGGPFGFYTSAGLLALFLPEGKVAMPMPYIEFERRFPFNSPLGGDNRISVGVSIAFCQGCSGNY
ncbi:MAG: hypothetical protein ABR987_05515 [Terracidiphilus sp.]|jgi:hypothetical protein